MRGEDGGGKSWSVAGVETPPRAWGRPGAAPSAPLASRNTPTCVGKTPTWASPSPRARKHPHVRGEDTPCTCIKVNTLETPPRAWGRPRQHLVTATSMRNTPTCVGKTLFRQRLQAPAEKHPHVRGEDVGGSAGRRVGRETPPRAWGRPVKDCQKARFCGNTPTCVGKTARHHVPARFLGKHPHVRGEDWPSIITYDVPTETPPRAWGRRRT